MCTRRGLRFFGNSAQDSKWPFHSIGLTKLLREDARKVSPDIIPRPLRLLHIIAHTNKVQQAF